MPIFLNGATDVITVAEKTVHQGLTTFSVIAWVCPTSFDANFSYVFWKGGASIRKRLYFSTSGQLKGSVARATTTSDDIAPASPINVWQFVAMTYDENRSPGVQLFRGFPNPTQSRPQLSQVTTGSPTVGAGATTTDNGTNILWGNDGVAGGGRFLGFLGDVGLWNRVLTTEEIRQQMQQPRPTSGCIDFHRLGRDYGLVNMDQRDHSGKSSKGVMTGKLATQMLASPKVPTVPPNMQ